MTECPHCKQMSAQKDIYTGEIVCYSAECYEGSEMKRVRALYDNLAVYAFPETIRDVKMVHVYIVGTEYPNYEFKYVEESELDPRYHEKQSGSRIVREIDITFRGAIHTVELRDVDMYDA